MSKQISLTTAEIERVLRACEGPLGFDRWREWYESKKHESFDSIINQETCLPDQSCYECPFNAFDPCATTQRWARFELLRDYFEAESMKVRLL